MTSIANRIAVLQAALEIDEHQTMSIESRITVVLARLTVIEAHLEAIEIAIGGLEDGVAVTAIITAGEPEPKK